MAFPKDSDPDENGTTPHNPGRMAQSLLDATSDIAVLVDPSGVVLAANRSLSQRLGISRNKLVGTTIYDYFSEERARKRKFAAEAVMASGEPFHYEDVTRSGSVMETRVHPVFEESGRITGLAVFMRDMTETRRAEEQRLRLGSAVEQAAEGIIIVNTDFQVEYVNQTFEDMTGFSLKEIKGQSSGCLYRGGRQKQQFHDMVRSLVEGEVWTGRTENTRKDGSVLQCDKTVAPIRGKGGVTLGYVSVWRDVTEMAKLERQLRQAQKMEGIGTLASGIAHDFNNILGPIILHSELNLQTMDPEDPARHSFSEILGAANRARDLISQILNLSRGREQDEPMPVHLGSIARECLKLLRPSLPSTIDITWENTCDCDLVMADPTQLHQVIMNLCTNAARAMGDQGGIMTLLVEEAEQSAPPYGQIAPMNPGRYVRFTVRDTGHGMDPSIMDRIFDPFFTTNRDGKGTGLGLAVVQSVLHRMGGSITVQSAPGKGSSFTAMLPCAPKDVWDSLENLSPIPTASGGTERILLVEDEASMVLGVRTVLEKRGYTVMACGNGKDALAFLAREPSGCDLVISDVTMPGMTGVELAKRLLESRPELPVILCSGYTELISPDEARKMGVRAFLHKPYGLEELTATIRIALDSASRNAEVRQRTPWPTS